MLMELLDDPDSAEGINLDLPLDAESGDAVAEVQCACSFSNGVPLSLLLLTAWVGFVAHTPWKRHRYLNGMAARTDGHRHRSIGAPRLAWLPTHRIVFVVFLLDYACGSS